MQEILVGGKVMMASILIVLCLLLIAALGMLYVAYVHLTLEEEFKDKEWMDNSEYDYGHNVHHTEDHLF